MAFADDIRSFMENRLQAFDPTIDLSANSTAQQTIIDPLIERLGEDPFSVEVSVFLRDRLVQEFPELAADNAGLLEDLFTNPLQLILEPFKRNIEASKLNMSVANADLMADAEADALAANFFEEREEGDFASGPARVYFATPTTVRITTDRQVTAKNGLAFFPTDLTFITSQQMLFNREGDLYFVDITIRAEQAGEAYNIDADSLISIDDVDGVVRITNKSPFNTGLPRETNEEFLGRIPQSLTEHSLVTKRGVSVRVPDAFASSVRAVQVVGAGEEGMNRDILQGTGEGYLHVTATGAFYGNWIYISSIFYKDDGPDNDITIQPGDTIRMILSFADDPNRTAYEAVIREVISDDVGLATEKYVLILDRTLETLIGTIGSAVTVAIFKPGFITISGIPGGMAANITVPDGEVHLGGHSDVFIRPAADSIQVGVIPNLTDGEPLLAIIDLGTIAANNVAFTFTNLVAAGVKVGDVLVIESGTSAGSYRILSVGDPDLDTQMRVDAIFDVSENNLRARIVRNITVDLVEPKVPKVPFQPGPVSDLQTTVGSSLFRLGTVDVQSFGVQVGDTFRILDGLNAGDYLIVDFDGVLGGQGPIVNRPAPATAANQRYEIFTASSGLEFPLVRIRSIELLDSTNQGTGITVPYGDAVDIRPTCDLEGAGKKVRVLENQVIVFPDASVLWGPTGSSLAQVFANTTSGTSDARYSLGLEIADGRVRVAVSEGPPVVPIDETEINLPPFLYNGRRDTLLAFTTREDPNFTVALPSGGQHRTSDIAEAKIGDSIVLLDGPNRGNYTIKDIRVLEMWGKTSTERGHQKIALVQVDREFPVDPLKTVIDFINAANIVSDVTAVQLASGIEDATRFFLSDFWTNVIVGKLSATLTGLGFSFSGGQVESLLLGLCASGYEVGPSATGTLRILFQEPATTELYFGDDPTFFQAISDESLRYRLAPVQDAAQILPESLSPTPPTQWNRDMALKQSDTTRAFLISGSSFVQRGIKDGDLIQFHKAINDLPARKNMTSSWMFVTVAGQNLVTAIFSGGTTSDTPDNLTNIEAGQLFFIDSGPDTGAYVITEVVSTNLAADPPSAQFKIDRTLTHSTDAYPGTTSRDFKSQINSVLATSGNTFPMALTGLDLVVDYANVTGPLSIYTHTFGAGPFNAIADVLADINGDAPFIADIEAINDGDELVLRSRLNDVPRESLTINASSDAIGVGLLRYTANQADGGRLGAVAVEGDKKIYGSGFAGFTANQWLTIYAANSTSILTAGEDAPFVGTYKIVSTGTEVGGPRDGYLYVELDRSTNFASTAEVRWLRHTAPDVIPSDTTDGGKTLSTKYVRGRLYSEVPTQTIITIPWSGGDNPILDTSEDQIDLAVSPVFGGENFGHKIPYRVIRDGVIRVSSTQMAENRQGALYYIDVSVIGIGTNEELNIDKTVGLKLDGRYLVAGYTLSVENELYAFSMKEQVSIILPRAVLPVGSTPDLDNEVKLTGQSIQINYDNAPLIANIQQFFDSPFDRVQCANTLVRHFLPSYVFLDATYTGGDDEATVAVDLIKYINTIDPDLNQISSDEITKIIHQHGVVKVKQPINLVVLTHGSDRRIRGTQSEDVIGGTDLPTFTGNYKQTYFISGPDTSSDDPRPDGEQVYLTRL